MLSGNKEKEERKKKNEWREREGVFIARGVMITSLTLGCQSETCVSTQTQPTKGSLRLGQNELNAGMKVAFQGKGKAAFHKRTKRHDELMGVGGSTLNEVWGEVKRRSLH